jgi:hypothetical protein
MRESTKCVWRKGSTDRNNMKSELPEPCKARKCKGEFPSRRKAKIWKKAHEDCCFMEED